MAVWTRVPATGTGTRSVFSQNLIPGPVPGHAAAGTRVFLAGTGGTFLQNTLNISFHLLILLDTT
jgi:hypothetical protein